MGGGVCAQGLYVNGICMLTPSLIGKLKSNYLFHWIAVWIRADEWYFHSPVKKWNGLKNGTPAINSVLLNLLKRKPLWPTTGLVHNCTSSEEVVDNNTSYLISHLPRNERRVSLWHEIKLDYGHIFDLRNHQLLSMCSRYLPACILPPNASHPKFRAFSWRSFPRHEHNGPSRVLRIEPLFCCNVL